VCKKSVFWVTPLKVTNQGFAKVSSGPMTGGAALELAGAQARIWRQPWPMDSVPLSGMELHKDQCSSKTDSAKKGPKGRCSYEDVAKEWDLA